MPRQVGRRQRFRARVAVLCEALAVNVLPQCRVQAAAASVRGRRRERRHAALDHPHLSMAPQSAAAHRRPSSQLAANTLLRGICPCLRVALCASARQCMIHRRRAVACTELPRRAWNHLQAGARHEQWSHLQVDHRNGFRMVCSQWTPCWWPGKKRVKSLSGARLGRVIFLRVFISLNAAPKWNH